MSYQSGGNAYQYANVPSAEDPLSSSNITNNAGSNAGAGNDGSNASAGNDGATTPHQQHQGQGQGPPPPPQQQHPNGFPSGPSTFAPRAYLPTYQEYMQNDPHNNPHNNQHQQYNQQHSYNNNNSNNNNNGFISNFTNAASNLGSTLDSAFGSAFGNIGSASASSASSASSAFGNGSNHQHHQGPNAYFESQRKSRWNRRMIGASLLFFLLIVYSGRHNNGTDGVNNGNGDVNGNGVNGNADMNAATTTTNAIAEEVEHEAEIEREHEAEAEHEHQNEEGTTTSSTISNNNDDDKTSSTTTTSSSSSSSSSSDTEQGTPKLTYLLSYPRSGTSFTMEILSQSTGMALATNTDQFHPYHETIMTNEVNEVKEKGHGNGHENENVNANANEIQSDHKTLRPICSDYPSIKDHPHPHPLLDNYDNSHNHNNNNINKNDSIIYGYPFWTNTYEDMKIPVPVPSVSKSKSQNVVTLSRCSGYCTTPCPPQQYIQSYSSFEESCRKVSYYNSTKNEHEFYLVPKEEIGGGSSSSSSSNDADGSNNAIIHLIRDPLSNIVSRFKEYATSHEKEWTEKGNENMSNNNGGDNNKKNNNKNNPMLGGNSNSNNSNNNNNNNNNIGKARNPIESFREWCSEMDHNEQLNEEEQSTSLFSTEMRYKLKYMKNIPCHSEFVKYVLWHNNVVQMSYNENYNSIQVYFEDYANVDQKIVEAKKMAEFLNYDFNEDVLNELPTFLGGRKYRDGWYTEEEKEALKEFIEFLAFDQTWELLKRYF